jgi:hypothetical protein
VLRGRLDLLVARVGAREAQVLAHRRVEQVGLLRDHADRRGKRLEARIAHVDPVDRHPPGLRLIQPRNEVAERRLARAGLADDAVRVPAGTTRSMSWSVHGD